ncbi:MAG TPA: hypothetical protein VFQ61_23205 [Polyangiaceae bacterium]|nr:hypothetical protein [Polyangiaceae bacterium]
MFARLLRWLRPSKPNPVTRLSEAQAIELARRSAAPDSLAEQLTWARLDTSGVGPRWIVGSSTIGLVLEVVVDDATGEVLEKRTLGVR